MGYFGEALEYQTRQTVLEIPHFAVVRTSGGRVWLISVVLRSKLLISCPVALGTQMVPKVSMHTGQAVLSPGRSETWRWPSPLRDAESNDDASSPHRADDIGGPARPPNP